MTGDKQRHEKTPPRKGPALEGSGLGRIVLWLALAICCFGSAWYLVLAHPAEAVDEKGLPVETAIGAVADIPTDRPKLLRVWPTYVYYQRAAPYFDFSGDPPVLEIQFDTTEDTGAVRLALTNLLDDQCLLDHFPYREEKIGSSVNYVAASDKFDESRVKFDRFGRENRVDDNTLRMIHRTWWATKLNLDKPHERYVLACAVDAEPDWESSVERHILFEGPRGDAIKKDAQDKPLPGGDYVHPGPDETTGLVRFVLSDAQDVVYEGSPAETPNSQAAHRYRVSFSHGSVEAHWTDIVASRQHDLWLFLAGVLAAFGATIVYELLKLRFPFEAKAPDP